VTTGFRVQTFSLDQEMCRWWACRNETDTVTFCVYFEGIHAITFSVCFLTGRDCWL